MLSRKVLGAKAVVVPPVYVEDIFSTWLYLGNGSTQTITNEMDLAGKGGMVWIKQRSGVTNHILWDTVRGLVSAGGGALNSNTADANGTQANLTAFNSNGFSVANFTNVNGNTLRYVAWTFCKQPKFFDVVSYTGNGAFAQAISHNLGSTPGFIIVKRTDTTSDWAVAAQYASGAYKELVLNGNGSNLGDFSPSATSTTFTVGGNWASPSSLNASGGTYIAYLFANNAGGFGIGGTESAVACGLYTTNVGGNATINLGWEPQWILFKSASELDNWKIVDIQRGLMFNEQPWNLYPNATSVEGQANPRFLLTPTGYQVQSSAAGNADYIYVAIRRPMKVPTDATKVFMPVVYTGTNVDNRLVSTTVMPDMVWARQRNSTTLNGFVWGDRLRGNNYLVTGLTNSENTDADSLMTPFSSYGQSFMQNGFGVGNDPTSQLNISTTANNQVVEAFSRAPKFFDTVCYTGTGIARTVNHGLQAVPELIIIKSRSDSYGGNVYFGNPNAFILLNSNNGQVTGDTTRWNGTAPTSNQFTLGIFPAVNLENATYVAELFASCPGVSKIGTYTGIGAGSSQNIDCGFTNGVRFVLIKRLDTTGQWILFDSARGITAANDPYLFLFEIQAEVTNSNFLDTYSAGFTLTINAPSAMNASGGTYLYLAIA